MGKIKFSDRPAGREFSYNPDPTLVASIPGNVEEGQLTWLMQYPFRCDGWEILNDTGDGWELTSITVATVEQLAKIGAVPFGHAAGEHMRFMMASASPGCVIAFTVKRVGPPSGAPLRVMLRGTRAP